MTAPHPARRSRWALLLLVILLALPASALAAPDATRCDIPTPPEVRCPDTPAVAEVILWVESTDIGARIALTDDGVATGRSCDGAARIVAMASMLYADIPAEHRQHDDLLWANPALTREVYAHAWAATAGVDNGNPVDIVFADYMGDPAGFQSEVYRDSALLARLCPGPPPPP